MTRTDKTTTPISGWASNSFGHGCDGGNSVIIAPDATPNGIVGWSIGQIQQLNVMLDAIGLVENHNGVEPGELCGAIRHQLQMVEAALSGAAKMLQAQATAA